MSTSSALGTRSRVEGVKTADFGALTTSCWPSQRPQSVSNSSQEKADMQYCIMRSQTASRCVLGPQGLRLYGKLNGWSLRVSGVEGRRCVLQPRAPLTFSWACPWSAPARPACWGLRNWRPSRDMRQLLKPAPLAPCPVSLHKLARFRLDSSS